MGAFLVELLGSCPELKLLVTSREALRVRGEQEYAVPPLAVPPLAAPDATSAQALDALSQYSSVALFTLRARAVKPAFELTAEQAPAVAAICARLDGLPLAIELAAARVKLMPPTALLPRLGRSLAVLADGARDLPERQRALRSAIAWSYDLLDERERRLLRGLSVFAGGWTVEAAEAVCGVDGEPEGVVMGALASLMDKSLIAPDERARAEPRFHLLETIREYGLERLEETGEAADMRRRHFLRYFALAEAATDELRGPNQAAWLERVEREADNVRAALVWALERGEAELGLRFTFALYYFWRKRGLLRENQRWLMALLALPAANQRTQWRERALFGLAAAKLWQGDTSGVTDLEEALALCRELEDWPMYADALHAQGLVAYELGAEARGVALLEESLALSLRLGDAWSAAQARWTLGAVAYYRGDLARAADLNEAGLAGFREVGDVAYIALLILQKGYITLARGDVVAARALFQEALRLGWSLDAPRAIAECLEAVGRTMGEEGKAERATRLMSAAARLRELTAEPAIPSLRVGVERTEVALRAALAEPAFAAAWKAGQMATLGELVEDALAW